MAPFSDVYAPLGQSVGNAVLLSAEEWNRQGGVIGWQIELILKDSACTYADGRTAAQDAIAEGASFIIGAVCADASEGVAQVASEAGVLQISPASVDDDLTLDGEGELRPLVFRVPVIDPDQGIIAARYALEQWGPGNAALLYAKGSGYGSALARAFQLAYEAGGGRVAATETYDQDLETFYEELEAVREEDPDLLYMPGYYDVANRLVLQTRSFGLLQVHIIGSDGWHSPKLDLAITDGCTFTSHYFADAPEPAVQAWVDLYGERHGVEPDAVATLSYDAANLLFTAIEETGVVDPAYVAETLESITFEGVSGPIGFDAFHNPVKPIEVLRAENGALVWQGRYAVTDPEEE